MRLVALALLLVGCASRPTFEENLHAYVLKHGDSCDPLIDCGEPCHEAAFKCVHDDNVLTQAEFAADNPDLPSAPPSTACAPHTVAIGVDLSHCNWVEVDAGSWRCYGARNLEQDGGP